MHHILRTTLNVLLCLALATALAGCSGTSTSDSDSSDASSSKSSETASNDTEDASGEFFDIKNWATLVSDPEAHKGAEIEIVGLIFADVEKDPDGTYFQMYADPQNMEWNTIVGADQDLDIKVDDWVRVKGVVTGEFEGENAFGASLTAPMISATSVEVVDALAAAAPAGKTLEPGYQSTQNGITITLDKLEFADSETRVHLTVDNQSGNSASFYDFNSKALQGSTQFDSEMSFNDYPEVQSDLLPGVKSSGVVLFPAMDPNVETIFYFEASSDDYSLDFTPYQFKIAP